MKCYIGQLNSLYEGAHDVSCLDVGLGHFSRSWPTESERLFSLKETLRSV
jgi:hypothetical protein